MKSSFHNEHKAPLDIPEDLEEYEKDIVKDFMIVADEALSNNQFPELNSFIEKWGLATIPIMIQILKNNFGENCQDYYTMCLIVLSSIFPNNFPLFGTHAAIGFWVSWYDAGCFTISNKYDE